MAAKANIVVDQGTTFTTALNLTDGAIVTAGLSDESITVTPPAGAATDSLIVATAAFDA